MKIQSLKPKHVAYDALFTAEGLTQLDKVFFNYLKVKNPDIYQKLQRYRYGHAITPKLLSNLVIESAPLLEAFIASEFGIEEAVADLQQATIRDNPIFAFKKYFVLRQARRRLRKADQISDFNELNKWVSLSLSANQLDFNMDRELAIAYWGEQLLTDPVANATDIERLTEWCVAAITQPAGQRAVAGFVSFRLPKSLDYANLIDVIALKDDVIGRYTAPNEKLRHRDGFQLTDKRMSRREVMSEVHYCVYCHKTEGDFCSKGFPVKKGDRKKGVKVNPSGETLIGCPLEEKISEMHFLKKNGFGIGALAAVMIDNPLCAATGHRICNDCMKACIYQKQEPVNIPEIETRVLTDVLNLPWGVEIYNLLMRWNPMRQRQYLPQPFNGKKVMIMGMGPAGFTLAHHLLMEGCAVVGAEGLKIEPLDPQIISHPIKDYTSLEESLDNRVMSGFGGVAEYGITSRWDKNFLRLIYIALIRNQYFQLFGNIRFGGTLTVDDVWELGFDHLALAVGAGLPRELRIPNSMAPGMRHANDFLMALQLTGAAKNMSLANLQVRLPAVVIGGGLTAVDTATEVKAYYINQVENILYRYEHCVEHFGIEVVRNQFDAIALPILDEYLIHGREVITERQRAAQQGEQPDFTKLIQQWGGVTIVYRRTIQESPAYKRNPEELSKAFEEGIYYAEGLEPTSVLLDNHGHVTALQCRIRVLDKEGVWVYTDDTKIIASKAIFIATGAQPNIAYEYEHRGTFVRNKFSYSQYDIDFNQIEEKITHCKTTDIGTFTSYYDGTHRVSFLGDTHPAFHGSVVKAIASAMRVYPDIMSALSMVDSKPPFTMTDYHSFREKLTDLFSSTLVSMQRLGEKHIQCHVRSPMAAKNFSAGQFYRFQNYERFAPILLGTQLQTEALALIGRRSTEQNDTLIFDILERGVSSRLVATLKVGDPIALMGPTGCITRIPEEKGKKILIIGGAMAQIQLHSINEALRKGGHQVFYVALESESLNLEMQMQIQQSSDGVLWLRSDTETTPPHRVSDYVYSGDLISALIECTQQQYWQSLDTFHQIHVIGDPELIRTVQCARSNALQSYLNTEVEFVASVYGPMQCMMKGVCAQCLQWQLNPDTGERTKAVYACSWQHQPIQLVDTQNITERLLQNQVQEVLSSVWLDYIFDIHSSIKI